MIPMLYMECGNLVTVNDSYCPSIPYMVFGNLVTVNDLWSPYILYEMWESCNRVPYMYDVGTL